MTRSILPQLARYIDLFPMRLLLPFCRDALPGPDQA